MNILLIFQSILYHMISVLYLIILFFNKWFNGMNKAKVFRDYIKIHHENCLKPKDMHNSIQKACGLKTIYRWI